MDFYERIRNRYGYEACNNLKTFSRISISQVKNNNCLIFLLKCREYGLVPDFIQNSTKNVATIFDSENEETGRRLEKKLSSTTRNFHKKILNLTISHKQSAIRSQKKMIDHLENSIRNQLQQDEFSMFFRTQAQRKNKVNMDTKRIQKRKLEELKLNLRREMKITFQENWFVNKTEVIFPDDIKWLLSLGPKFALPVNKTEFPLFKVIADVEEIIKSKEQSEHESARACFTQILQNHLNSAKNSSFDKYINKILCDTKKFLKRHPEIYIVPADKGNVTVAILKNSYIDKMNHMMSDRDTYDILRNNPTNKLQIRNNSIVKDLFNRKIINLAEKKCMTTYTANTPKIYGLPKIHKENCPLRPICSSINVPCYQLSKYIVKILNKITEHSRYNVKNATEFIERVEPIVLEENDILVSFDVVSLFTNIPIEIALQLVEQSWDTLKESTNINKKQFLEILKFCIIENNYLEFNNITYKQKQGVPMGSPLSPIIADIVMEALLDNVLSKLSYAPKLITKYVDDLFLILKSSEVNSTLMELNSFHPKIQFTVEIEKEGMLPYLDLKVIRNNRSIIFDWYKKPTSSGRLINFNSKQPKQMIINTARNFIERVLDQSDIMFRQKNIEIIMKTLLSNSFPKETINSLINNHFNVVRNSNTTTNSQPITYRSSLYIPDLSNRLLRAPIRNKENTRIAFKPANTIRHSVFTKLKDKVTIEDKSDIVYKIKCLGNGSTSCPSVYVGTSKQKLRNRLAGHRSDINSGSTQKTALALHCIEENHRPDFKNVGILQTEKNYNKRMLLEMLHIKNTENSINRRSDCDGLSAIYGQFINRH